MLAKVFVAISSRERRGRRLIITHAVSTADTADMRFADAASIVAAIRS
jgi:hypothetical protein